MMTSDLVGEFTLTVTRTVPFPRDRVFAAWTDPLSVKHWFAPDGLEASDVEMDVRAGGSYRIGMRAPDGTTVYAAGEYREVSPPRRLVFTWLWERDDDPPVSVVTVDFHERDGSTEISLTHDGLPTAESRDGHQDGWLGILEKLESALS